MSTPTTNHISRYQPCFTLHSHNIPCIIWCEDALAHYGVPTVVFTLYLLVQDINQAASILSQAGWHREDSSKSQFGNALLQSAHRRLTPSVTPREIPIVVPGSGPPPPPSKDPPGPTTTILLPASEWNYTFPLTFNTSISAPLPALVDALIDKFLDDPLTETFFWNHLSLLIAYLYGHVPALKQASFAEELKYEHRQFHYDCLAGMSTGLPFIRHERKIREGLRNGTYRLCECSADKGDESLFFTDKLRARLLAAQGVVVGEEEDYEVVKKRELELELAKWDFSDCSE